jgi:putative resolvase
MIRVSSRFLPATSSETPTIAMCTRVSSRKQASHKETQIRAVRGWIESNCPRASVEEFTDIGSGLNFKRPGLQALLDSCLSGRIQKVVVAYKDRLCRFGFDLFDWLLGKHNVEIVAIHSQETDPTERVTEDILTILTVFAVRFHGMRSSKKTLKNELVEGSGLSG